MTFPFASSSFLSSTSGSSSSSEASSSSSSEASSGWATFRFLALGAGYGCELSFQMQQEASGEYLEPLLPLLQNRRKKPLSLLNRICSSVKSQPHGDRHRKFQNPSIT